MSMPKSTKKFRGLAQRQALVADYLSGSQNVAQFCQSHSIGRSTFYAWLKKLGGQHAPESDLGHSFTPIRISEPPSTETGFLPLPQVELTYTDGTRLVLPAGTDVGYLRCLLPCFQP